MIINNNMLPQVNNPPLFYNVFNELMAGGGTGSNNYEKKPSSPPAITSNIAMATGSIFRQAQSGFKQVISKQGKRAAEARHHSGLSGGFSTIGNGG